MTSLPGLHRYISAENSAFCAQGLDTADKRVMGASGLHRVGGARNDSRISVLIGIPQRQIKDRLPGGFTPLGFPCNLEIGKARIVQASGTFRQQIGYPSTASRIRVARLLSTSPKAAANTSVSASVIGRQSDIIPRRA